MRPRCSKASKCPPQTTRREPTCRARALITDKASSGCWEMTAGLPGLRMPAFSIEGNRGNDRERRVGDHVRRIEPAAKANFEDDGVGGDLREGVKRGGGRDLEKGHPIAAIDPRNLAQQGYKLSLADRMRLPVATRERDPLVEADKMRRRIDMHAPPRRLEHGLEICGGRPFAVGSGNVDDGRQMVLRVAELCQQLRDAPERQIDQQRMQSPQLGQKLVARRHGIRSP